MPNKAGALKVLHVIPSLAPARGGPSKAIIEMVAALRNAGIDAEIATTNDNGARELNVPLNKLSSYQGVPVRFFKRFSPAVPQIREFAYSGDFRCWFKQHVRDYDLIHVHAIFSFCSTYAMTHARNTGTPYVVRTIGQLEDWALQQAASKKKYYLKLIEKANLEAAAAVQFTALSEQQQALKRLPTLNATVIPLGVDLPEKINNAKSQVTERWGLSEDLPVVLFLSRIHPKKGLELLMQAFAKLPPNSAQLVIAGDGDETYLKELRALSEDLKISDHCQFVGFVKGADKDLMLQGADLYALTSYSENFGIAVLEAMASGTAPMVTKEVALSEMISEQQLGYVCELTVEGIASTLSDAIDNLKTTHELGLQAKEHVSQHYQWTGIAERLATLYRTVSSVN